MAKQQLTNRQARRIQARQEDRAREIGDEHLQGIVIGQAGHQLDVETPAGLFACKRRKNIGTVVTGDRVVLEPVTANEYVISAVQARDSLLARPDSRGKLKAIAANIDRIYIVTAVRPALNEGLVDRYLVAAETLGITPVIMLNKTDMISGEQLAEYEQRLAIYRELGYEVIFASAKQQHGADALVNSLAGHTSILVGQSGVGKSSLLNMLMPELDIKTAEISDSTNKGRHTTTASRLYHLPCGGNLIDSPGVREFGLWEINPDQVFDGFREFEAFRGQCKFNNCQHDTEPGCAIHQAVAEGKISQQRFDSYRRIVDSLGEYEK